MQIVEAARPLVSDLPNFEAFKALAKETAQVTLSPTPYTLNPQPSTLHPQPSTLHPQPSTLNPQPSTAQELSDSKEREFNDWQRTTLAEIKAPSPPHPTP